jgi:Ca2+-binding RTX toxin-like protein
MATINGTPGNDTLTSTGIGDVLVGGTGSDLYIVNDAADTVVEQGTSGLQGGITRVSTDSSGVQGNGNSTALSFSADGSKVLFSSSASNLVAGDSNGVADLFVKDLTTGATSRVSTDSSNAQLTAPSLSGSISPDGTHVVFESNHSIFLKDLTTNVVTVLAPFVDSASGEINQSFSPVFSPDGTQVSFVTRSGYIDISNDSVRIGVKNITTGAVVSFSPDLQSIASQPVFSSDGTKVAFAENDSIGALRLLYVGNIATGAKTLITTDAIGLSEDSRYVGSAAFIDHDSKIVYAVTRYDQNFQKYVGAVYSKDLTTGTENVLLNAYISEFHLSADGSKLIFTSTQGDLVPGDTNGVADVFEKDLVTGEISLLSRDVAGSLGNAASANGSFSSDGNHVLFSSHASNLLSGDTNSVNDVFIKDLTGEIDTVQSSVTFALSANVENLTLTGSANINGIGNNLNNLIIGNSGDNILNGNSGRDTLVGGLGNDLYVVDSRYDVVRELNGEGTDRIQSSDSYSLGGIFVENLTLVGSANIDATGNFMGNVITGNSGNNILNGGAGNDTLIGGTGNDTYIVDSTLDVVTEGLNAGTDLVLASVSYTLSANVENLTLTGTGNINGVGNAASNQLIGNSGNNHLTGNNGNDTFDGGLGADTMTGGTGNDVYYVDNAGDVIVEVTGGGTDRVYSSADSYTLSANLEVLQLQYLSTVHNGTGNDLDNTLYGNNGNNVLTGGAGNDTLRGGSGPFGSYVADGNDTLIGGTGNDSYAIDGSNDVVVEASGGGIDTVSTYGSYILAANVENLNLADLNGFSPNTSGRGNALDNNIHGNGGNNYLNGMAGNDTLLGGAGTDTFQFTSALNATTNKDLIVDYTAGEKIQLDHLIFTQAGATGALLGSVFTSGAGLTTGQDADDRIIYNTTTGNLYYDADGSGAGASVVFAQIGTTSHAALTAAYFQII